MNNYNHEKITSVQNDRVKQWASLLDKKFRDRTGKFVIEGVHLLLEAIKASAPIETIVYDGERGIPPELQTDAADSSSFEWVETSIQVMAKCTGTDTPPPIFAVVGKLEWDESSLFRDNSLVVVLDGVRDPGNVGTIIRSADAVGADAVVLGKGCVDLYNPKTVRSTMGSLFHLPLIEADLTELLPAAKERGIKLIGTSLQATHTCYSYDWTAASWLLLGNESNGLSATVREQADEAVIIPMRGQAESLNVAMAGTVLLYEAMRQREFN
ncbi:TrmH family RNA methyltransferase [Paenibacillus radicis (ex Gao et al. 2016)]|uniref:23S rRNA methyltransferase n=1 Tax=Paenibacillus radicis (ex Gao et al. 2016) TaxID=1737354 RepID=A0A917HE84_9BACL|nr:RNA methyltransferase [Paenibacillus radicis (ex Gao et al. 2016)]GGG76220.1 23S rRNA methyltransferase [Paenibacillus radicis (ex Gao et al. 2016)]